MLRRYLPKGLFARTLLIIVLPVALMQFAVVWSFFDEYWETVTIRLAEGVAGDISLMTELWERAESPEEFEEQAAIALTSLSLSVNYRPDESLPTEWRSTYFRTLDRTLRRALSEQLENDFWFDTTRYRNHVDIRVEVEGGVLRYYALSERVYANAANIFLLWIAGATVLLTAISIVFIRNQVKPIRRLADAAEQFGRGNDVAHFRPAGASEVRQAAHAFLEMRNRLKRHIDQRTALLAGVSHDLRTPLTRLRLQLALMPDGQEREDAIADVAEMEVMLDEYLDFARGQANEDTVRTDISALLETTVEAARRDGSVIELEAETGIEADVRPGTVRRCLSNLIGNAVDFGDHVAVSLQRNGSRLEIFVDDDGPGIPEDQIEEALKPFNRLDESRNLNRKGVGLGLAIARDVARSHGGDLRLSESPMGGLRAKLSLPA